MPSKPQTASTMGQVCVVQDPFSRGDDLDPRVGWELVGSGTGG